MDACDFLFETLAVQGGAQYDREPVSQLDHALQCAALAERDGASAALVVAALFHDLGHLISTVARDAARRSPSDRDDRHETKGAAMLGRWFGSGVTEPVRLHVAAKRYLCAVEPGYRAGLSPASRRSLALQGDPFDAAAAQAFIRQPCAADAVRIRRWDDLAKVPALEVPRLDHYRRHVESLAGDRRARDSGAL